MAASNLNLGKASGGVLNVQPADGTGNTNVVIPENGTLINDSTAQTISAVKTFTSSPIVPTPTLDDNSTKISTTEYTDRAVNNPKVTYISQSGHNSIAIVSNGKIYTTSGTNSGYSNITTGRGLNGEDAFRGVDDFKVVNFPNETGKLVKTDGYMYSYSFALFDTGNLYTWGYNGNGACGLGHTNQVRVPTLAATGVIDAYSHPSQGEHSVGDNRLFILKSDGLYASGYNPAGQLGVGDTTNRSIFTKCVGFTNTSSNYIKKVFAIGSSSGYTFMLSTDNKIWFAGTNTTGCAGNGTTANITSFTNVTNYWVTSGKTLSDIKVVGGCRYYDSSDSGTQCSTIMLLMYSDGTSEVKSAGLNAWGNLGTGNTTTYTSPQSPLNLPKDGTIIDIAGFGGSPLTVHALKSNGDLYTWGYNGYGQLGNGTTTNSATPTIVTTGVTKLLSNGMCSHVSTYYVQSFVQKSDGLYACGINDNGYCGIGNNIASVTTFTKVLLPSDDNQVALFGHYTTTSCGRIILAYTTKGNLYAWGYNAHNGITTSSSLNVFVPVQVTFKGVR